MLAPGVELLGELSGSGYRNTPGLVRRGDGQTLQVTPLLYRLLGLVDGRRGHGELAEALGHAADCVADADDIAYLLEEKLRPLGLLQEADGSTLSVKKANPLLALRLKFVITDPELTRRVTSPFARLFRTQVVVPSTLVFLLAAWWVLFDRGLAAAAHEAIYSPELLLVVFALTLVSAGFHEFGHAAACRYGGATPGAMGGGLYLVWPAFYTDVDDSYRLSRWGRLRVDLGGLYFNALFAVAMAGLALITGKDAFLLVVATQLLQMLRQLAPFMRADGYHILADLTGVPDLFFHIKPTLLGLWPPNWRRPQNRVLRPWARVVVTLWVLVVVPVLLGLLALAVWILPRLAATAWDSAGLQLAAMNTALENGDPAGGAVRLLSLFSLFLPVAAITYLLVRIVRSTSLSVWRSTEDRPRLRMLALVGAALVVALVGWAWWPSGQYEPVTGKERGTLQSAVLAGPSIGKTPLQPVAAPVPERGRAQQPPAAAGAGPAALSAALPAATSAAGPGRASVEASAVAARAPQSAVVRIGVPAGSGAGSPGGMPSPVAVVVPPPGPGSEQPPADGSEEPDPTWPFPWPQLPAPSDGDNRAVAVNTTDGSSLYEVSYSLVILDGGRPAENRNEAWALASCTDCKTVAVAFQVVLVVGYSDTYVPVNAAVAANYECTKCVTEAVAVQLVASLTSAPTPEVEQELARAWAPLEWLRSAVHQLTVSQIHAVLRSVEQAVIQVLLTASPTESPEDSVLVDVAEAETEPEAESDIPMIGDLSMDGLSESLEGLSTMSSPDYGAPVDSSASPSPTPAVVLGSTRTPRPTASPSSSPSPSPSPEPSASPTPETSEPVEPTP